MKLSSLLRQASLTQQRLKQINEHIYTSITTNTLNSGRVEEIGRYCGESRVKYTDYDGLITQIVDVSSEDEDYEDKTFVNQDSV